MSEAFTRRELIELGSAMAAAAAFGSVAHAAGGPAGASARGPSGGADVAAVWEHFIEALRTAGKTVARQSDPLDRAEGLRTLTRMISLGFDRFLEYADPERPHFYALQGDTRKFAGDNPDQRYAGANIRGDLAYRIRGDRGNAVLVEVGVYAGGFTGGGKRRLVAYETEETLPFASDGQVELTLSPDPAPPGARGWIQLAPDASSVLVRQYFADPLDKRSSWEIARTEAAAPAPPLTADALAHALGAAGAFAAGSMEIWGSWLERTEQRGTNVLTVLPDAGDLQTPKGIRYREGVFDLAADEALVVDFRPTPVPYWGFLVMNRWMESLEYRERNVSVNNFQAKRRLDGSTRIVVADSDPALADANWIDTAGHRKGLMSLRWARGDDSLPEMPTRVVPFAALSDLS